MRHLQKIINWANSNENIRALILSGSLTSQSKQDMLSDFDIAVYGNDLGFIEDDDWLNSIQQYWVCIHDRFEFLDYEIPTRLTIFDGFFKVDFSFHPMEELKKMIDDKKIPEDYNIGYEILLDKDGILKDLPKPMYKGFVLTKPNEKTFNENVKEFWFECYHVAKYLYRNDLWVTKTRDQLTKKFLLQMLKWNEACKRNWSFSPKDDGKQMSDWLDKKYWNELQNCFGRFAKEDEWTALINTIQLYQTVAKETARFLQYKYDERLEEKMFQFVKELKSSSENR
jgi:aminoglycoside 6-adenylyltransferase